MKRLCVIRNGFDLHFGLPTNTDDFKRELAKLPFGLDSARDAYLNYGVDWSIFEENLADISLSVIEADIVEIFDL